MLSIGKLGIGQERYYLDKVAEGAEDYYSGEGEAAGEWIGEGATRLGLDAEVGPDQLTAMLTGRNPVDGEPLLGRQGVPGKGAVPGFDLTFSAPKSVSLLWGLGGPVAALEVQAAHRQAVDAALGYLQREACWTRRGAGGAEFIKGEGYLAAAYRHRTSRNGDPQLHTHVLIANATRAEGRWTRLYHPAIYDHATTASYIYEAHLRHELTRRLGVEWQDTRKGIAEMAGFADEHLRAFSTRRAEILEAAGPDASAASRQVATLATRKAKEADVSRGELLERWRSRAEEIGLGPETIAQTFDPEAALRIGEPGSAAESRTLSIQQIDNALTSSASHFDRRNVIQAVADSLPAGAPGAEVERLADAYLVSDSVIQISESRKGPRFTTRRIWELEREALAAVERMKAEGSSSAGELIAARVIGARPTLKSDQREMVRRLLTDSSSVAVVIGEAGTGKTFAIVAAAEGWAQAGIELRAAAPTWRAANVMRSEGLPALSIASLLVELDRAEHEGGEELARGSVLLIDEAAMVDSATLARLIAHAERAQAKLVLVGDPEQLGEIESGGLFRAVADRTDTIHLDEVIRHEHDLDRVAAGRIREGEGREALGLYESGERVTVAPNAEARREAMVSDWHRSYARGEDAVLVAKRNAEVQKLNAMAREVRHQAGKLGAQEIEIAGAAFAAGDQVITRVNDRAAAIYNRERWRIAEVDPEQRRIVLEGIDQARRIEVGADYLARTNPHSEAPALEHAYAVTTYSAQGSTVDRAYVMADPSMDKQELYVAASRGREETYLYATPEIQVYREEIAPRSPHLREGIPHIAEAAERDRAQLAAHDEALRSRFSGLPTKELIARRKTLRPAAERESREGGHHREVGEPVGPAPDHSARHELALADRVLAERRQLAITAARLSTPPYIRAELGERPSDPAKRKAWDRGVEQIERYRQEHGVKDQGKAFGPAGKGGAERARQEAARRRLRETQRSLGRDRPMAQERGSGQSIGPGR
jgi:conjugative relaxase-like TrwC/TraI family protein